MADLTADIVIVGSGAAGLSAALSARHHGADVLVLERADRFGGTTAVSGGVTWVPNNDRMSHWGVPDSLRGRVGQLQRLRTDLPHIRPEGL